MSNSNKTNNINDIFSNKIIFSNLKGKEIIKSFANNLPKKPGVYQMEDEKGDILYIGKAKNLS